MQWFHGAIERIKKHVVVAPIQCPRGWGTVTFQPYVNASLVAIELTQTCPIGGVTSCAECQYLFNPDDIEGMRERLRILDDLRVEGVIIGEEYQVRRRHIIELREGTEKNKEEGFRVAAWIVGPLGLMLITVGSLLSWLVHMGFVALAGVGTVMLTLGLSFRHLSQPRKPITNALTLEAHGDIDALEDGLQTVGVDGDRHQEEPVSASMPNPPIATHGKKLDIDQ